jgi:hypothetical protein
MVDPLSWLRFSHFSNMFLEARVVARRNFGNNDYEEFLSEGCECTVCDESAHTIKPILPIKDFWYSGPNAEDNVLNDDFYLLCSPIVRGYAFNERKWGINLHL